MWAHQGHHVMLKLLAEPSTNDCKAAPYSNAPTVEPIVTQHESVPHMITRPATEDSSLKTSPELSLCKLYVLSF